MTGPLPDAWSQLSEVGWTWYVLASMGYTVAVHITDMQTPQHCSGIYTCLLACYFQGIEQLVTFAMHQSAIVVTAVLCTVSDSRV